MIPFWKYQAIGNDFPFFREEDTAGINLRRLAIKAADRKFGIGGDGILVLGKRGENLVELQMFNPDGTEDFCGNGLRIAAKFAFDNKLVGPKFTLLHRDVPVQAEVLCNGRIRTTLGIANYDPEEVPVQSEDEIYDDLIGTIDGVEYIGSALTTGSTHSIIPVMKLPSDEEIARIGPAIENLPIFPDRTSVIFTRTVGPKELDIRIWERGVGETLGCGTGSSAAAADHFRRLGAGGDVVVHNPGGDIVVSMSRWNAPLTIEGTAELVYSGHFQMP